jgi:hypothetical protein
VLSVPGGTISLEMRHGKLECHYAGKLPLAMAADLAATAGAGPQVTVDGMPAVQWLIEAAGEEERA